MPTKPEHNKRTKCVEEEDDSPTGKRSKCVDNEDEEMNKMDTIFAAWEHYRNFLDSDAENEGGVSDVDELQEVIEMLSPFFEPDFDSDKSEALIKRSLKSSSHVGLYQVVTKDDISNSYRSIQSLIPALLSMSYFYLGNNAILHGFESSTGDTEYDNNDTSPQEYLEQSLKYFPGNAAALSMLANYKRMKLLETPRDICKMYELASLNARSARDGALLILEDGEETDSNSNLNEWVELLFLNGMSGVEYLCNDEEEDAKQEQSERNGEADPQRKYLEEKEQDDKDKDDSCDEDGQYSFSQVEATSSFMAALLNSIMGDHGRALDYLQKFDVTHRIHPNVWNFAKSEISSKNSDVPNHLGRKSGCASFEPQCFRADTDIPSDKQIQQGVIPSHLYEKLIQIFGPLAPYWSESDYNNRGYYSYFHELDKSVKDRPSNLIEDVVVNHLLPLAESALDPKDRNQIVGFEWWTHTRAIQANLGHQLHFDTDETLLEQEKEVTHPIISSVLYLTGSEGSDCHPAGSTIVFDQTPDSQAVASKAWVSQARNNSYMIFPGDRLHGVLPCPGKSSCDKNVSCIDKKSSDETHSEPIQRLTFMVGFWTRRVPDKMRNRHIYGPCGPLPPLSSPDHTWVNDISKGYEKTSIIKNNQVNKCSLKILPLPHVCPAWECIDTSGSSYGQRSQNVEEDECELLLEIPQSLDHRFFVKDAPTCFHVSLFKNDCF